MVGLQDYTGYTNSRMYLKFPNLSCQASTASTTVNLVWTDIAAKYLLGANSNSGVDLSGLPSNAQPPVDGIRLLGQTLLKNCDTASLLLSSLQSTLSF